MHDLIIAASTGLPQVQLPSLFQQVLSAPPSLSTANLGFLQSILLTIASALRALAFLGAGIAFLVGIVRLALTILDKQNSRSEGHKAKAIQHMGMAVVVLILINIGLFLIQSAIVGNI